VKTGPSPARRLELKSENYAALGYRMVANFVRVVSDSEKPLVSGCDVLDSVGLVDECYTAATRFEMPWYEIPEVKID
jgi:hypothetical protein